MTKHVHGDAGGRSGPPRTTLLARRFQHGDLGLDERGGGGGEAERVVVG